MRFCPFISSLPCSSALFAVVWALLAPPHHARPLASRSELLRRVRNLERHNRRLRSRLAATQPPSTRERGVSATLQVAAWPFAANFGHLDSPPNAFFIEVGSNTRDLLVEQMAAAFQRGAVLLSFEPLLDKYAALLARHGGRADHWSRLGLQHERGLAFPFAVGCDGTAQFNVAPMDGCSSLLTPRGQEFTNDARRGRWHESVERRCVHTVEKRQVPCVSLEHVIGEWLDGQDIAYLKVDAQGYDIDVVMSAGRHLNSLRSVTLEAQCDTVARLYENAPNCSSVYRQMRRLGFVTDFDPKSCLKCIEVNMHFTRPGALTPRQLLER